MGRQRWLLMLIVALVAASVYTLTQVPTKLGLDLRGGAQLTIQVSPSEEIKTITERDLEAVQKVIENRVNGLGVAEAVVQTAGQDQIVVQLPGVDDPDQAERVLGGTAQLDFKEQRQGTEQQLPIEGSVLRELQAKQLELRDSGDEAAITANKASIKRSAEAIDKLFDDVGLTGKNLKDAFADNQGTGAWSVAIRFDSEGGDKFAELTKRLAGTGRSIGIFLDDVLISAPVVGPEHAQTGIQGGGATITGSFDAKSATELGVQLKGGSLPVPISIVEKRAVSASLGQDSINRSLYAGLAGLFLVFVFMVVYYRLPGIIAAISLAVYTMLTLALFNIFGVTLTLPGIAGFILSIGMAVDANVLIFERTREELRAGKSLYRSVESGFFRAFSSILDGNVTTLIACAALFFLGAGLVKGFALTLAIGVVVSMFTALTCSRTLLLYVLTQPSLRRPELFAPGLAAQDKSVETA
ncbi:protein translocase subunit SecD [filamentous cyanobacterium LEGE 11480]|uniref:Protein translocase subunit SecD n=1 Tax=Romeriopsis navalis LEGE 11480 TaxID=2777977 RepID=A0A928VM41_9CYAN|nr:protein translocase subunit SecD [Romeriopsis navalis]MBE9028882.1 protein translocase subunit SecD [Romeriopsis navalis LEGE 11480]